jgi:hypothetical protein
VGSRVDLHPEEHFAGKAIGERSIALRRQEQGEIYASPRNHGSGK